MINKEKIEKAKQSVITTILSNVENAFQELYAVGGSIENKEKELLSLTLDYTNLEAQVSDTKKFIEEEQNKLKRNKEEHVEDVAKFRDEVAKFEKQKASSEAVWVANTTKRDKLLSDIAYLTQELKSLNTKIKAKDIIAQELEYVKKDLLKAKADIDNSMLELEQISNNKKLLIEELNSINSEISKQRSIILPTIEELKEREKALKVKESDLDVIIDRYKKLYGEQGANFKI